MDSSKTSSLTSIAVGFIWDIGIGVSITSLIVFLGMTTLTIHLLMEHLDSVRSTKLEDAILECWKANGGGSVLEKQFSKITIIVNPRVYSSQAEHAAELLYHLLQDEVGSRRVALFKTRNRGGGKELASSLSPNTSGHPLPQLVMVLGGDGTVHEVINGLTVCDVVLFALPFGRTNNVIGSGERQKKSVIKLLDQLLQVGIDGVSNLSVLICKQSKVYAASATERFPAIKVASSVICGPLAGVVQESEYWLTRYIHAPNWWRLAVSKLCYVRSAIKLSLVGKHYCSYVVTLQRSSSAGPSTTISGKFVAILIKPSADSKNDATGIEVSLVSNVFDALRLLLGTTSRSSYLANALEISYGDTQRFDVNSASPCEWLLVDGEIVKSPAFSVCVQQQEFRTIG